jgi:glycosyltransferase involved in cell wall biosynthesis
LIQTCCQTISVIICAYTEERWYNLVAAVESLRNQTCVPEEIIIVIDHNETLLSRARDYFTDVVVIENKEEKGLSGSRNSGIKIAHGSLIAFLDDDAVADTEWLAYLSRQCVDKRVMGAGGTVEPLWSGTPPSWLPKEFYWVIGCTYQQVVDKPVVVRNPYGGCTCIKREVFEQVGGFRNGIGRVGDHPVGGEETELSIRATHYWPQRIFLYEPRAKIYHYVPSSRTCWRYFIARCYAEGLSKSAISRLVGAKDALASERAYTLFLLPKGIVCGLMDAIVRRKPEGLQRTGAIIIGLVVTTIGYIVGTAIHFIHVSKHVNLCNRHNVEQMFHHRSQL